MLGRILPEDVVQRYFRIESEESVNTRASAIRDSRIQRAVTFLKKCPERKWTFHALARECGISYLPTVPTILLPRRSF